ncbi:translation elongation factor Ts [Rhodopirellula sp. JC740]|uniref:Elongation factor Ts n=1 Tax=Rhodopirellula halodulae TaxID=2894198 RepID=A0ABS8NJ33_9BACT|nr:MULTISPECIES: translation elongation factor Ts [unclassified Rhodopirellula]MCC9643562.1 translation elongation factor Ts [Rhodopirellula sp. JC740]MCC9654256.1 translation elongation factor Ts [Rhodopirellula sp. JC737]
MTTISAKAVSELRKSTGAGMMDCKKALEESGGDLEGALDYLRKKGQKVAAKRADREASEGVVVSLVEGNKGLLLGLSCETDFVAKNQDFIDLANTIAKLAFENNCSTIDEVNALEIEGRPVKERLVDETGKVGEKIEVSSLEVVEGENLASYIHAGAKIGVLVSYKDGGKDGSDQFFRGVSMHIAAMKPQILDPSEFDEDFVQKETEALQAQIKAENDLNEKENLGKPMKNVPQYASRRQLTPEVLAATEDAIKEELKAEGKPEKIWDKILPGKLERFIADNTLLDQERCLLSQFYALDDSKTVEAAIKEFHPEAEVVAFKRVAVN